MNVIGYDDIPAHEPTVRLSPCSHDDVMSFLGAENRFAFCGTDGHENDDGTIERLPDREMNWGFSERKGGGHRFVECPRMRR